MLNELIKNNHLVSFLFEKSNFTHVQLDTLLINFVSREGNKNLFSKTSLRDGKRISGGSFLRTLRMSQRNIRKSMYSLILLQYLSILSEEDFHSISEVGNIIRSVRDVKLELEKTNDVIKIISDMANVISIK